MTKKKHYVILMRFLSSLFLIFPFLLLSACSKANVPGPSLAYPEQSIEQLLSAATELRQQAKYQEAELRLRAVIDRRLAEKPLQLDELQATLFELGSVASLQGNDLDAYNYYTRSLKLVDRKDQQPIPDTESRRQNLLSRGNSLMKLARYSEADADFTEARFVSQRLYGAYSHQILLPLNNLGALHLSVGDLNKAEAILIAAQRVAFNAEESTHKERVLVTKNLLTLYKKKNNPEKVRELRFMLKRLQKNPRVWQKR